MVVKSVTTLLQELQNPPVEVGEKLLHFSVQGLGMFTESDFMAVVF
jgi:hypothetical protein